MKFDLAAWGAELSPDRPAIWFSGRWYTYHDLNERATRLANRLAASGIGFGARVGILSGNHLAHFDLLFAAPKLGFVFVPFDPHLPAADLREQARAVQVDLLFCETRCAATAAQAFDCPLITLEQYRGWLGHSSRQHIGAPELSPESIQMILFSGGSAGGSKAVLIPYRQTLANAQATAMGWDLGPEDCAIQATPCFHAALNVLATPLLTIGGRVVLVSPFEPGEYLRLAQRLGVTVMFMVPAMYQVLVGHPDFAAADLGRVRWAICGGAPCPPSVARAMLDHGIPFRQGYVISEAGVNCFAIDLEESALHPESVGRPMSHVQVEIRRPDGSACASDEVGELTLAGEALCSGYLAHGDEWQSVCRDGWFWTGDLAERDNEDRYYIRGRREDMYVSGGENVYPAEVESAIGQCAGVAECAVLSIPDARWGATGLAAVVMHADAHASAESLRAELRNRFAAHKIPAVILFVEALPRTDSGTVDRPALRWILEAQNA